MQKHKKYNSPDFPAKSWRQQLEREVKIDFESLIGPELRGQVANWKLVLLRNKPCDHSNQRNCPCSASRKLVTPTRARERLAPIRARRQIKWRKTVSQTRLTFSETSQIANHFSVKAAIPTNLCKSQSNCTMRLLRAGQNGVNHQTPCPCVIYILPI